MQAGWGQLLESFQSRSPVDGQEGGGATWRPAREIEGLVEKVGAQELLQVGLRTKASVCKQGRCGSYALFCVS